jgi:hypothetical protein
MKNSFFSGFILFIFSALLWLVPITSLTYTFRTDISTNDFYAQTGIGETTETIVLSKAVYESDTFTIEVISDLPSDAPVLVSYNGTTRATVINGLAESENRTLEVSYDTDALNSSSWGTFLDMWPQIWMVLIICFPLVGLVSILMPAIRGRKK